MRTIAGLRPLLATIGLAALVTGCSGQAQAPAGAPPPAAQGPPSTPEAEFYTVPPASAVYKLEDAFLRWPVLPGNEAYAKLDGKHLHRYVVEQAAIGRRYRDQGHPKYWGRIIGTSADAESAEWLAAKFKQIGLADVRIQWFDLDPIWMPQSWEITATSGGKTLNLDSAQPTYQSPGTPPEGLELEAVYVGMGSEAEFAGRDVRGKAVFMFSMPLPGGTRPTATVKGAALRAQEKGAAAILTNLGLPGNFRNQQYSWRTNVPTFVLGMKDGYAIRDLIGKAPAGQAPRVKVRMDARMVPDRRTASVWGTLPGRTDETIYVMAHRDGWFDAAGDNASGVGTMLGLAEYYAKMPQSQRRRTMIFLGSSGHHGPNPSAQDLQNRKDDLFAKTALFINAEHPSTLQAYLYWEEIRWSNTYTAQFWYAGGPERPKLQEIAIGAFRDFGVSTYAAPERRPPPGELNGVYRFVPGVTTSDFNMYFHSDGETPETVPWTGLEATTRSYAKIIDEVNKLDLADLKRPEEPAPTPGTR